MSTEYYTLLAANLKTPVNSLSRLAIARGVSPGEDKLRQSHVYEFALTAESLYFEKSVRFQDIVFSTLYDLTIGHSGLLVTNILQVSTFFTHHGGVEKSVNDLVHGLKLDHDVKVLCTRSGAGTTVENEDGVEVTSVGSAISLSGRPVALRFPHELRRKTADVVHYHLPFPLAAGSHLLASPRAKLSVATWHHDLVRNPTFNRCIKPMMEAFLDRMDLILVTAPPMIEHVELLYRRRKKCRVVPLGIAHHHFEKIDGIQKSDSQRRPMLLFVGRLVYYKGCDVLIKSLANVDADLSIVGEGPLENELKELVESLGLAERVKFYGRLPDDQLFILYKECDIFVLPSTLPTECFGLVQVEAMLCGKPIINTDLPTGVPWVSIHNETGITVPPANIPALTAALDKLCRNEELRHRFGQAAKLRSMNFFTLEKHVETVRNLYQEYL